MLLAGLVLWSRMMAGLPSCLGVNCLESVSTCLRRPSVAPDPFRTRIFPLPGRRSHRMVVLARRTDLPLTAPSDNRICH